jgi:hypothetical protein
LEEDHPMTIPSNLVTSGLFHYTFFLPEFKLYSCICPPHEPDKSWDGFYVNFP